MRKPVALLLIPLVCSGCTWATLGINNAHHMTVEQATAPRIEKRFRVLDAETRQPVPKAELVVVHNFDWMDDWVLKRTTGADGLVTIELAKEYLHLVQARVAAPGYLSRDALYFGDARKPGNGPLSADPVDIFMYRAPASSMGVRVPEGFAGSFVYKLGATKYDFPFPPNFPLGQRVWWTVVQPNEAEVVVEQSPPLGGTGWNRNPVASFARGADSLPVPEPGAEVEGIAAWHIGVRMPNGPWGGDRHVIVVGDRKAALGKAQEEWKQHGNGDAGFIYNGWLKPLAPEAKLARGGAYAVTRNVPPRRRGRDITRQCSGPPRRQAAQ